MSGVEGGRRRDRLAAGEDGSATVIGVGLLGAVLALLAGCLQAGSAIVARHHAESAADLAALASAAEAVAGPEAACRAARRVADRMATALTACRLDGWDVFVSVEAPPGGLFERFGVARASARAGPGPPDQSGSLRIDDERSTPVGERRNAISL